MLHVAGSLEMGRSVGRPVGDDGGLVVGVDMGDGIVGVDVGRPDSVGVGDPVGWPVGAALGVACGPPEACWRARDFACDEAGTVTAPDAA